MPMINLLPWRAELRQKRKKEFVLAALGAVLMGAALSFGTKMYFQSRIANQESRNQLLRSEITELDRQIAEINELQAQKSRLIARMAIIEELQRARPETVHLMDEAVDILPQGTHLTSLTQDGAHIEMAGITQSSTRVSVLMRNVHDSGWLQEPEIELIEYSGSGPDREGEFTVFANQIRMGDDTEGLQ